MLEKPDSSHKIGLDRMGWDLLDDTEEERVLAYREGTRMLILRIITDHFCRTIDAMQKKRSKKMSKETLFIKEYEMDLCVSGIVWKQHNFTVLQNELTYLSSCYSQIGKKIVCVECLMSDSDLLHIFYDYFNKVLGDNLAQLGLVCTIK